MKKHMTISYRITICLAAVLLCCALPSRVLAQSEAATQATIATAMQDLQSADPEIRRGSVMLLGKYPMAPGVLNLLVGALPDRAAPVRRAAVVSLIENIQFLGATEAEALLQRLADEDREVRLNVAGALQNLLMIWQTRMMIGRSVAAIYQGISPVHKLIHGAITDPEPLVRSQALAALRFLGGTAPQSALLSVMSDPEVEVRMAAYETAASTLPGSAFIEAAMARHPDPDPRVRRILAETLANRASGDALPLLDLLREDPDQRVRLQAELGHFYLQPQDGFGPFLADAIADGRVTGASLQRVFFQIQALPATRQRELLQPLLSNPAASVRANATSFWLSADPAHVPATLLITLLGDASPEVRQQVLRFLINRGQPPPQEVLAALPEMAHEDVRLQALFIARSAALPDRQQLAVALLVDPAPMVRQQAVQQIATLRPPQWQRLLRASLRDPDPNVQQGAASALLTQLGDEGRTLAQEFAEANPNRPISGFIRQYLNL